MTGGATVRSGTPLRGICPEGWHVPALAELEALLAAGPAAGFFRCAGYWIVNGTSNRYGDADKGYLISCEATAERSGCLVYSTTTDPVTGEVAFTLSKQTTVTYTVTRTSGVNPTLSWIAVQQAN